MLRSTAILQNTIDALAGIRSVVRVDGLTSGGLPPAATIQQIRIRQNSFDAEYHEATPAFVEIITNSKPQPWHVSFTAWDRPEDAQARNAFNPDAPAAQRSGTNFNGTGHIGQRASVSFFGNINSGREDQPIYAQTPGGPVRGLVDNPSRFQYGTVRIGLDNWRHNDPASGDFQDNHIVNLGAEASTWPSVVTTKSTTIRARVLDGTLQRAEPDSARSGSASARPTRLPAPRPRSSSSTRFLWRRAISGHAGAASDRVVRCGHRAVGSKQVWRGGLLFWHGGYDSSIVSNAGGTSPSRRLPCAARQPTLHAEDGHRRVLLGRVAAGDVGAGRHCVMNAGDPPAAPESRRQLRPINPGPRGQIDWSPVAVPHTTFHLGAGVFYGWLTPGDSEDRRVDGIHSRTS